ncbi:hypothetical protein F4819DRAFT_258321 [Hypoxylon fuscum]|nr:hypothetical protein F4819DRAFT_258321 [Hypoxylon fuscum]
MSLSESPAWGLGMTPEHFAAYADLERIHIIAAGVRASKRHAEKARVAAGGGQPKSVSTVALACCSKVREYRALKLYHCSVCNMSFNIKGHLDKHNRSKKHLAKVSVASPEFLTRTTSSLRPRILSMLIHSFRASAVESQAAHIAKHHRCLTHVSSWFDPRFSTTSYQRTVPRHL